MTIYQFKPGHVPILVSIPHAGTRLPDALVPRFTDRALTLPDTDWHLPQLYDFLDELQVSWIVANYSRYVIDLNRPPDDHSLYPGQITTELCPTTLFDGSPIYRSGASPNAEEIRQRIQTYWQPYHRQLQAELARLREAHGLAVLWDAHSIRSQVPRLFSGTLPDLNLGTFNGRSADSELTERVFTVAQQSPYTVVLNGRFQGGYITRHYGHPSNQIHALQLELVQDTYMQAESPFAFLEEQAIAIRPVLRQLLETVDQWTDSAMLDDAHAGIIRDAVG